MDTQCSQCGADLSADDSRALRDVAGQTFDAVEAMLMADLDFDTCDDSGAMVHVVEREAA